MAPKRILVTGANRGIGFSIVQGLAEREKDLIVFVTARSLYLAEEAISSLKNKGLEAHFEPVELDVTSDVSIKTTLFYIERNHGGLDSKPCRSDLQIAQLLTPRPRPVLINNAGIAPIPSAGDPTHLRDIYNSTLDTNITSVALLTTLSIPLLRTGNSPRVINISSARASISALTSNSLPPTASIPYSLSKVALNVLGLEFAKCWPDVGFYAVSPGHCRTALNGFKGKRDPGDGARVVVELALAGEGGFGSGFWGWSEDGGMQKLEW